MRNSEEIEIMLHNLKSKPESNEINAQIDTIENDLQEEEIEEEYCFEGCDPWIEQAALKARQWLDVEITNEDLLN